MGGSTRECSDRFDRVDRCERPGPAGVICYDRGAMELSTERIEGADPAADVLFLHGILGRGANLRTLAKRFVAACPDWSVVLVDLRGHGASRLPAGPGGGVSPVATLEQCRMDVEETVAAGGRPVLSVLGHSFGGKVALALARSASGGSDALGGRLARSAHYVIVDSLPGPRETARGSETTLEVLELLASLPGPFATRQAFALALVERGLARGIAEWLATSLRRDEDGFRFGIDLALVRALLDDYFRTDLWPSVETPADPGAAVHLVIGDRSTVFDAAARERASAIEARAGGRVTLDVLPAGHWVHVDAPDALLEVLVRRLGSARALAAREGERPR